MDMKKLQNGSDIRGVALEGIEGEKVNLGEKETKLLTEGFVEWLSAKTGKDAGELVISVGHDSRLSAEMLKSSINDVLGSRINTVFDCGLASTPAMFMSTVFDEYKCDGAIMITASHLPFNRNGFKYFDCEGGLQKEDISDIIKRAERLADECSCAQPVKSAKLIKADLIGTYCDYLSKKIREGVSAGGSGSCEKPLEGLHIAVDCGNGAGGFYASRILEPLGCDITGSQFLDPDGSFPNHQPNPENKEAMASICRKVLEVKADLGIIFDTDVDRSSAVASNGREISRNAIVAMAAALIAGEHPGTTVVTDSITSDQLTVFLEKDLGLRHLRFKRGYKNVINKSQELNAGGTDSQLAIETSGHAAYKENFFLDDGAYLATKIVIEAARLKRKGLSIESLIEKLEEPKEATEVRFPIKGEDFKEVGSRVLDDFKEWAKSEKGRKLGADIVEPNYEGVRMNFRAEGLNGWCLLRKSLHDPILPLNVEVTEGSCDTVLKEVKEFLSNYPEIG